MQVFAGSGSPKPHKGLIPPVVSVGCRLVLLASSKEVKTMARLRYCRMKKNKTLDSRFWDPAGSPTLSYGFLNLGIFWWTSCRVHVHQPLFRCFKNCNSWLPFGHYPTKRVLTICFFVCLLLFSSYVYPFVFFGGGADKNSKGTGDIQKDMELLRLSHLSGTPCLQDAGSRSGQR